ENEAIAGANRGDRPPPGPPPAAGDSPGARVMTEALAAAVDLVAGKRPGDAGAALRRPPLRARFRDALDETVGGRLARIFALRLMISMGVATLVSQEFALQRSYWVMLTVAIVLRPDFGSVFARALQRGIGTVVGAVAGALIIAVVPGGPWLLLPCAVLAGLLPYGQVRNWGLFSTFLTPLVVILIDLLQRAGWVLALDRLIDTLLGCAIVLLVGYAPWPSSWHAHLPAQLAAVLDSVVRYYGGGTARHARPVLAPPPDLPSPVRPSHGVSAHHGRTPPRQPSRGPAVARGARRGAADGHPHHGRGAERGLGPAAARGGRAPAGWRAARDGRRGPGRPGARRPAAAGQPGPAAGG
ncbi:MAG: FUSC family protein, partial [Streptosporangiales bacterium]